MRGFITEYWLEFIFGLVIAGLSFCIKVIFKKLKKKNDEDVAIKAGMVAILHDRLFQTCNYFLELGYIPLEKAEEILDNLRILYEAYHALGGNGTGTDIYNRTIKLPLKKAEN